MTTSYAATPSRSERGIAGSRGQLSDRLLQRLNGPLFVGGMRIDSRVMQSPLAGVTDLPFRQLVRQFAPASLLYTEMVHARGLVEARKEPEIAKIEPDECPIGLQLFDRHPELMAIAARKAEVAGAQVIDINMGCPVKKITGKGGGSSLLREPELAQEIVTAVSEAVRIPVTVKTRLGWCDESIDIVKFALGLQSAGAKLLTLHARTRMQGFKGKARWGWIARVKQALEIPVIANGDIRSVGDAIACLEASQADGVMCARGTLGAPYLVGHIDHYLKTGQEPIPLTAAEQLRLATSHVCKLWDYKGRRGIYQARKHMKWYLETISEVAQFKSQLCRIETIEEAKALLQQAEESCCYSGSI